MTIQSGLSGDTAERYLIGPGALYVDYGEVGERLLGATSGGSTFTPGITLKHADVDGALGPVVGLERMIKCAPVMTINLFEMTKENILLMIPGGNESSTPNEETITKESVGVGDGLEDEFTLDNTLVVASSYTVYIDDVVQVETTAYTIVIATGVITFVAAPGDGAMVTVSYTYDTEDAATHDTIVGGSIALADYCTNIALIGEVAGHTYAGIFIVKNGLSDGSYSVNLVNVDSEAPSALVINGHFDPDTVDRDHMPWEIRWPRS